MANTSFLGTVRATGGFKHLAVADASGIETEIEIVSSAGIVSLTVADESSDTSCFPLFATAATGVLAPKSGTNLTFNSSTGDLGATILTGNLVGDLIPASESAEHGAGFIGTAATPTTKRWIEGGVIVTSITFDLTGLASVATANDIVVLGAGGDGYLGRNVVATNGIIFRTLFSCIESPAGGDNDVNVVTNSSGTLTTSGAGGVAYIANAGDLLAGQSIENLLPAMTANHYFYATAGTGDTAATYTAGMYELRLWGRALLT